MLTGPLFALDLDSRRPPGVQIEQQLRGLIRSGRVPTGAPLPSTRVLASDLGVSRGVAVRAYAELAAEGYIRLRRGAAPLVVSTPREPLAWAAVEEDVPVALARYNLRPDLPDLSLFPRAQWLTASRAALHRAANHDLAYGEPFGAAELRHQLAPFLGRTRGVVATPSNTGVFAGSSQALLVLASVLREHGARRIAVEDPGHRWRTRTIAASGLEVVPVGVDEEGINIEELDDVDAVVVSPDHHFPFGVALSAERRRAIVDWASSGDRLVIEHDYDAHFRYDRSPAGALQALAPDHVAYVGSASAVLAPTLRLGWAVMPAHLIIPVANMMFANVIALPRLMQHAFAEFIARGYLDRHLRRVRTVYKRRRELVCLSLPDVQGRPVGLFVALPLSDTTDEAVVLADARRRGVAVDGFNEHASCEQPPGLAVGFAALPEPTLRHALRELIAATRATEAGRARGPHDYGR
jgi:GntR family transcriptional regulator / MocR family aminotransferase